MNYLGENRVVTNPFSSHITAEDYAGSHESKVSIYGTGKVVKVINKFHCHEDSINYNNFLKNKALCEGLHKLFIFITLSLNNL